MKNKKACNLIISLFCFLAMTVTGCKAKTPEASGGKEVKGAAKGAQRPVPITAAVAVQKNIPIEIKAIGNIESYATVSIKARVNGELQKVHFTEGQEVSKGKLLFSIDPRPFQSALNEASARLEKDKALFSKAEDDYRRYENLLQRGSISREQFDQVRAGQTEEYHNRLPSILYPQLLGLSMGLEENLLGIEKNAIDSQHLTRYCQSYHQGLDGQRSKGGKND